MDGTWRVGVLLDGTENVRTLAVGSSDTVAEAVSAATDALVCAALAHGRHEYRVAVAGTEIIIMPGLDQVGAVDFDALRGALGHLAA
ncbi:hypothetical protein [Pseudonocardia sp.]|uniref:hypothetical protein n=1 Tax=Pseudonocardia sp. TaxID=60912 RepID=UPI00262DA0E1|nr:hypothetical protein [Pseudonocardia sp.]